MRNDFESNYLAHHGILGMKWGVRRYQNPDGTLTSAGRNRYGKSDGEKQQKKGLSDKQKRALKIGAAVAVTALATYGGYKLHKHMSGVKSDAYKRMAQRGKEVTKDYLRRVSGDSSKIGIDQYRRQLKTNAMIIKKDTESLYNNIDKISSSYIKSRKYIDLEKASKANSGMNTFRGYKDTIGALASSKNNTSDFIAKEIKRGTNTLTKYSQNRLNEIMTKADSILKKKKAKAKTVSFDRGRAFVQANRTGFGNYSMLDLKNLDLY